MGMSIDKGSSVSAQVQEVVESLTDAESHFVSALECFGRQGSVVHVRQSALSLALMRAFQTSLGTYDKFNPVLASNLLGEIIPSHLRRILVLIQILHRPRFFNSFTT